MLFPFDREAGRQLFHRERTTGLPLPCRDYLGQFDNLWRLEVRSGENLRSIIGFGKRSIEQHAALAQHQHPLGKTRQKMEMVRDSDHCLPGYVELARQFENTHGALVVLS